MVDAQQREIRSLQVRDDAHGQRELDPARDREMRQRHRGNRLTQMERRVQRSSVGGVEEHGLKPELDRGCQGRGVETGVAADAGRECASTRRQRCSPRDCEIYAIADEWHDERHIQGIRAIREHSAVAEEQCLDRERDRNRDDSGPRSE